MDLSSASVSASASGWLLQLGIHLLLLLLGKFGLKAPARYCCNNNNNKNIWNFSFYCLLLLIPLSPLPRSFLRQSRRRGQLCGWPQNTRTTNGLKGASCLLSFALPHSLCNGDTMKSHLGISVSALRFCALALCCCCCCYCCDPKSELA